MKILVTGGAGFIGSWIVDALIKDGHQVIIIDNLSSGSLDNLSKSNAVFYNIDIRDDKIREIFKEELIKLLKKRMKRELKEYNQIQQKIKDLEDKK